MSARLTTALVAAAAAVTTAFPVQAQTRAARPMMASVDTALLHGLRYRNVGPPRGGRVTTVTGVRSQPRTFYMGVASGGLPFPLPGVLGHEGAGVVEAVGSAVTGGAPGHRGGRRRSSTWARHR